LSDRIRFVDNYSTDGYLFYSVENAFRAYSDRVIPFDKNPSIELLPMTHRKKTGESPYLIRKYTLIRKLSSIRIANEGEQHQFAYGVLIVGPDIVRLFLSSEGSAPRVITEGTGIQGRPVPQEQEDQLAAMIKESFLQRKKEFSIPEELSLVA